MAIRFRDIPGHSARLMSSAVHRASARQSPEWGMPGYRRNPDSPADAPIAPWPHVDRYPVVMGSSLTLSYLSAVYRLCQTGYRREYVDCLDELLERDAHAFACLLALFVGIAGSRIEIEPADVDDAQRKKLAQQYADEFTRDFFRIKKLRLSLMSLLWGAYYGVSASEIGWQKDDNKHWSVNQLYWIHSRRLTMPDPSSWSVRIWDMGMVRGWDWISDKQKTNRSFGLDLDDYPGKFITFWPQLRGDYPTRDGFGRETAYWMAIKLMASRGASQYVERFGKPWVLGKFRTTSNDTPRMATPEDVAIGDEAVRGIGAGSISGAMLPDSLDLNMLGPGFSNATRGGKLTQIELIELCDRQVSKATMGTTDSVESGSVGARAATESRRKNQENIQRYLAATLGDCLSDDLAAPWQKLNHPDDPELAPNVVIYVEDLPKPTDVARIVKDLAGVGAPLDVEDVATKVGLALLQKGSRQGLRLLPVKPIEQLAWLQTGEVGPEVEEEPEPDPREPSGLEVDTEEGPEGNAPSAPPVPPVSPPAAKPRASSKKPPKGGRSSGVRREDAASAAPDQPAADELGANKKPPAKE